MDSEENILDWGEKRVCPRCQLEKDASAFRNGKGGKSPWCGACRKRYRENLKALGKSKVHVAEVQEAQEVQKDPLDDLLNLAETVGALRYKALAHQKAGQTWQAKAAWKRCYLLQSKMKTKAESYRKGKP